MVSRVMEGKLWGLWGWSFRFCSFFICFLVFLVSGGGLVLLVRRRLWVVVFVFCSLVVIVGNSYKLVKFSSFSLGSVVDVFEVFEGVLGVFAPLSLPFFYAKK